jgi:hypothetical protein
MCQTWGCGDRALSHDPFQTLPHVTGPGQPELWRSPAQWEAPDVALPIHLHKAPVVSESKPRHAPTEGCPQGQGTLLCASSSPSAPYSTWQAAGDQQAFVEWGRVEDASWSQRSCTSQALASLATARDEHQNLSWSAKAHSSKPRCNPGHREPHMTCVDALGF